MLFTTQPRLVHSDRLLLFKERPENAAQRISQWNSSQDTMALRGVLITVIVDDPPLPPSPYDYPSAQPVPAA